MLSALAIRDVVLIDRMDLLFEPGLCVLTGETGAGKSILLDSLGLALGARADAGLITIRSKNIAQPPLDQVEDATKQLIKYANLLLPPFLVIGYGLMRWRRRLSLKRSLESGV